MSNDTLNNERKCDFCEAVEGKPRPLGKFVVKLNAVEAKNGKTKYACQSCIVHHRKNFDEGNKSPKKSRFMDKIKSAFLSFLT